MKKFIIPTAAGLLLLGGCGSNDTAAPAATPTVTVTEVAEKEVEVREMVVPQACLDALDYADEGFTYAADAMDASSRALFAAGEFDIAGIEAANDDIDTATSGLNSIADDYVASKESCREQANG